MSSHPKGSFSCPHCDQQLKKFQMPDEAGWDTSVQWACFNNDCPYYRNGWDWMWEKYKVKVSYRYRVIDLETGATSPLAVWSETALLDRVIESSE